MLIVSTPKVFIFAIVMGILSACCSICYFEYTRYSELPIVQYADDSCKNVVNFKNGDAYNCNDVDVLLRKYRKATLTAAPSIDASAPVAASEPTKETK